MGEKSAISALEKLAFESRLFFAVVLHAIPVQ